jgi:uncharacterized protein
MALKADLHAALTAAMKARDEVALSALRQALSAIAVAETAGAEVVELSDEHVQSVLAVEVRKHHEAADAFDVAGRAERVTSERAEAAVLEAYLPAAMSAEEIDALIAAEIAAAAADGAVGMKAMGRVVAAVRAKAGSTADGAAIAASVKAALLG